MENNKYQLHLKLQKINEYVEGWSGSFATAPLSSICEKNGYLVIVTNYGNQMLILQVLDEHLENEQDQVDFRSFNIQIEQDLDDRKYCDIIYIPKYKYFVAYDDWNRELVKIFYSKETKSFKSCKMIDFFADDYYFNRLFQLSACGDYLYILND